MAYPIVRIDPTTATRERSPALWNNALDNYADDKGVGVLRADDFEKGIVGAVDDWEAGWWFSEAGAAGAASESFATNGEKYGEFVAGATTDTDHEGIKMQGGASASISEGIVLPTHATAAKRSNSVYFEARVYMDLDANDTMIVGLFEPDTVGGVLGATSLLLDDVDYIGFYRVDAGDLQFVVRNDNAGGTAVEYNVDVLSSTTIAASYDDTWVKLGFRVNSDSTCQIYIDGVEVKYSSETTPVKIAVTSTSLPEVELSRTLVAARGATADNGTVAIKCDWIDCFVQD
jgi:hypothetical protein